jgi:hypothetical protein
MGGGVNRYELFLSGNISAGQLCRLLERDKLNLIHMAHGFENPHQKIVAKQIAVPPRTEEELKALLRSVVKEVSAMSPQEVAETIKHAGIVTKSGKLSRKYGGRE